MRVTWLHQTLAGCWLRPTGWRHAGGYLWRRGDEIVHRDEALRRVLHRRALARVERALADFFATATDEELAIRSPP